MNNGILQKLLDSQAEKGDKLLKQFWPLLEGEQYGVMIYMTYVIMDEMLNRCPVEMRMFVISKMADIMLHYDPDPGNTESAPTH